MPIWHQSPKLTPRYFLETPRLFGYPFFITFFSTTPKSAELIRGPLSSLNKNTLKKTTTKVFNIINVALFIPIPFPAIHYYTTFSQNMK